MSEGDTEQKVASKAPTVSIDIEKIVHEIRQRDPPSPQRNPIDTSVKLPDLKQEMAQHTGFVPDTKRPHITLIKRVIELEKQVAEKTEKIAEHEHKIEELDAETRLQCTELRRVVAKLDVMKLEVDQLKQFILFQNMRVPGNAGIFMRPGVGFEADNTFDIHEGADDADTVNDPIDPADEEEDDDDYDPIPGVMLDMSAIDLTNVTFTPYLRDDYIMG